MNVEKVNHIGIAVRDLESSVRFYEQVLGLKTEYDEVPEQKVRLAMLEIGESNIELLEAIDESSPIAKYIEKRGEGIHHICIQVDDIDTALEELKRAEVNLIDQMPRSGAHGTRIAFIHPKSTNGVLIELCQVASDNL